MTLPYGTATCAVCLSLFHFFIHAISRPDSMDGIRTRDILNKVSLTNEHVVNNTIFVRSVTDTCVLIDYKQSLRSVITLQLRNGFYLSDVYRSKNYTGSCAK